MAGLVVMVWATCAGWTQSSEQSGRASASSDQGSIVNRGKYIVEDVAVCGQCHTPHDGSGRPDQTKWLQGGPVWLQPADRIGNWPQQAPAIAGSLPGTDEEMVRLLTTGTWRDGKKLRPPMPQFRMSRPDAESVVAYLKSLSPSPP